MRTGELLARLGQGDATTVLRCVRAGLLPDRRPAAGSGVGHLWTETDLLVLRVLSSLAATMLGAPLEPTATRSDLLQLRRALADAVRRCPDAPFLVGQRGVWMRAETAEEAVELLQGVFEGHAWVVPLAAIAAALAEPSADDDEMTA